MVPERQSGRPPPTAKKKRRRGKPNCNVKAPVFTLEPTPPRTVPVPAQARRLPLLELGPTDCRFIVTTAASPRHLYCAVDASAFADKYGGNCYCAFHQRVMRASGFGR